METKVCTMCGEEKPATEEHFYWRKDSNKFRNQCTPCRVKQSLETLNGRYNQYRCGARERGYTFEISKEDFDILTQQPCYYCGSYTDYCKIEDKCYSGIDRRDNSLGYIEGNMVSCCAECNFSKHKRNEEEYIEHCKRVAWNNGIFDDVLELCKKVAKKHS